MLFFNAFFSINVTHLNISEIKFSLAVSYDMYREKLSVRFCLRISISHAELHLSRTKLPFTLYTPNRSQIIRHSRYTWNRIATNIVNSNINLSNHKMVEYLFRDMYNDFIQIYHFTIIDNK